MRGGLLLLRRCREAEDRIIVDGSRMDIGCGQGDLECIYSAFRTHLKFI